MPQFDDEIKAGLKAGMRRLAASVCVISLKDAQGERQAMTATAVSSLSDDPASLLICVNKGASAYPALMKGQNFCVNVLHDSLGDISALCAGMTGEDDRFSQGEWKENNELPYLGGAEVNFFCENDSIFEYGTHAIIVGKFTTIYTADSNVSPLIYADGKYTKII